MQFGFQSIDRSLLTLKRQTADDVMTSANGIAV
jgi:hypothetical protein